MSGRYNIVKEFIVKPAAEAVKKVFKKKPKNIVAVTGTNGKSSGFVPWLKIFNDTLVGVN